jgi:hypothetical protein
VVGNLDTEEKCILPKQFYEEFKEEIHIENSEENVEKLYVCLKIKILLKNAFSHLKKNLKNLNIIMIK